MIRRAITIGAAALVCAIPAAAQERGTMEFGAFATVGSFDNSLGLKSGFGGGGRIGMFVDPRWSTEFEMGEMRATRPTGLKDVNVGILSARLTAVALKGGSVSFLLGAGAGIGTETNFMHTYGVNALAGLKFRLSDNAALRIDVQNDWFANYSWKSYQRATLGLSLYRQPHHDVRTVEVAGPSVQRADSVSADEQARRRRFEGDYRALRDSVNNIKPCMCTPPPAPAPARARELFTRTAVLFEFNESTLTKGAKDTLDVAVRYLKDHGDVRVEIQGHTDSKGSDDYNMKLGLRRAESVKVFLGTQGISLDRVSTRSFGETQPVADNELNGQDNPAGRALNRRVLIIELS
jgi:outer membrane protein OmpA-like peptidoglycan-associated protein